MNTTAHHAAHMSYALHTTATYENLMRAAVDVFANRNLGLDVRIYEMLSVEGEDDCFYGWGEAKNSDRCVRHVILSATRLTATTQHGVLVEIARELMRTTSGDVVITDHNDFSIIIVDWHTPARYTADHAH